MGAVTLQYKICSPLSLLILTGVWQLPRRLVGCGIVIESLARFWVNLLTPASRQFVRWVLPRGLMGACIMKVNITTLLFNMLLPRWHPQIRRLAWY